MSFWETFWPIVFVASLLAFGMLAVVVTLGGLSDIRAMLRTVERNHDAAQDDSDEPDLR